MRFILALLGLLPVLAHAETPARTFTVTPTITADAYAQGDFMGSLTKLTGILPCSSCPIELRTLAVLDKAKAKDAFDIYFFSRAATIASADNAAFSVTDAEMATSFAGRVAVAAADFTDTADNSVATLKPELLLSGTSGSDLWIALVCTDAGGCDYGATTDLTFRLVYLE